MAADVPDVPSHTSMDTTVAKFLSILRLLETFAVILIVLEALSLFQASDEI